MIYGQRKYTISDNIPSVRIYGQYTDNDNIRSLAAYGQLDYTVSMPTVTI